MDVMIRRARHLAGLSLRQLAARAGTSHPTLLAYEQGTKVPRADTRDRIIRAAGFRPGTGLARRITVDPRGTPRGLELEDVLLLAEAFPAPPRRPLDAPSMPRRRQL